MSKLKDKLFYLAVEKNQDILKEYQAYKWSHEDKEENKLVSWMYLLLLNTKYRVLRIDSSLSDVSANTSLKRNVRLPYLEGAESGLLNRPAPHQFAAQLLQYDIVSFDIFDTLILRPFAQPHDLFMLLAEKHNQLDFMSIRRNAEAEARNIASIKKGNREVTIYDIYEIIEYRTGINKEYGVQVELDMEMNLCFANPYMMEVFKIIRSQGKKIIAVSDMYLTKNMIIRLLEKCGYSGLEEVYVSSEYNGSKRDKHLFKVVLNKIDKDARMVHIGDNYQTDIISAQELGIAAKYYENVHEAGNLYRADGMSDMIGSTYKGVVNTHLHNGLRQYTPHYEYGFIYGGLYVLGYCKWIHDYAKQNNIDKILFLSRDGEIYRKVFNFLYSDVDNEYVYWSRIANMKYAIESNRDDFLTRMVAHKAVGVLDTKIKSLLNSLDLGVLLPLLDKYELREDEIISKGNVKLIERLFIDNWDTIVSKFTEDIDVVKEYLTGVIQDAKKIAVVDVGWIGSGGKGIKYLIQEKFNIDCEVKNLVAATRYWNHHANIHDVMNKGIEAYLFSRAYNRSHYDIHSNTNKGSNSIFFELFTQASHPSFAGFKKEDNDYNMIFDVPEVENYKVIEEIQKGIFDFVRLYKNTFSSYPTLFNISGYDAYLPFRMIIKDLKFIKTNLGDVLFSRGVFGDTENQVHETLRQILDKSNLN